MLKNFCDLDRLNGRCHFKEKLTLENSKKMLYNDLLTKKRSLEK